MKNISNGHIPTPSEKERRYDRQLRLWAARGQKALESAHVVLVNSGCGIVGVETLKNIILPGIGRFTIIDQARITEADFGANFFIEQSNLGKSRASCCVEFLKELNPDVQGDWYPKAEEELDIEDLLEKLPAITVILYALPIHQAFLPAIHRFQAKHAIPVVSLHSSGFYSFFRVDFPQIFPIIDTHPEPTATIDLRALRPWPELSRFAADLTQNMDTLDDYDHGHLPYVIIILHYLAIWTNEHSGKYPSSLREKSAFKKSIEAGMRRDVAGSTEENFEEAITMLRRVVTDPGLPLSVRALFDHSMMHHTSTESDNGFWTTCQAVGRFFKTHKVLPLPGNLPDMKAQSNVYVKLQLIYKQKARKDAEEVFRFVRELPSGADVRFEDVELFCRNAAFARVITPSKTPLERFGELAECTLEEDRLADEVGLAPSIFPVYMALNAVSQITGTPSRQDILDVLENATPGASDNKNMVEAAEEVSRAMGNELHNISAFTGGLVGQELIKIITQQYVPVDNTCVFDGISSRCQVLRT